MTEGLVTEEAPSVATAPFSPRIQISLPWTTVVVVILLAAVVLVVFLTEAAVTVTFAALDFVATGSLLTLNEVVKVLVPFPTVLPSAAWNSAIAFALALLLVTRVNIVLADRYMQANYSVQKAAVA